MFSLDPRNSSTQLGPMLAGAVFSLLALAGVARAVIPYTSATVTKVENRVTFGDNREQKPTARIAAVSDIVRAHNYLLSEADSRAELQYPDGTLVRIGQNSVFSFDADSRTLTLDQGSLIFHIPKGNGGGTIKTPSLTAAITGTTGKVSPNYIVIIEGTVTLIPSGRQVHTGEFARRNADGTITIGFFDPAHANDGKLVFFNGLMPGFQEAAGQPELGIPDLRFLEVLERTQNLPGSIQRFFPEPADRNRGRIRVPQGGNPEPVRPNNY